MTKHLIQKILQRRNWQSLNTAADLNAINFFFVFSSFFFLFFKPFSPLIAAIIFICRSNSLIKTCRQLSSSLLLLLASFLLQLLQIYCFFLFFFLMITQYKSPKPLMIEKLLNEVNNMDIRGGIRR